MIIFLFDFLKVRYQPPTGKSFFEMASEYLMYLDFATVQKTWEMKLQHTFYAPNMLPVKDFNAMFTHTLL